MMMLLSACFHRRVGSQVGKVTRSGGVKKKKHTYNSAIPVCIFSRLLNCRLARKQPQPEQQQKSVWRLMLCYSHLPLLFQDLSTFHAWHFQ